MFENSRLIKLTELLSDGQYHDGPSVGEHLGITRAAVWKIIKKLEQYGVPLSSVKGKGYRLDSPLVLLDPEKITSYLQHSSAQCYVVEKTESTNTYLKSFIPQNKDMRVCVAETQTAGQGRMSRQWHSPFAENLYCSILCPFEKDISELSGLSLVIALAICRAVESCTDLQGHHLKVKWPNDVLLDQCKLAGILIEIQAESHGSSQIIIGVGLNVNMTQVQAGYIDQLWTSLRKTTGQYFDRNRLCATLTDSIIDYLERFSSDGLAVFMNEWQQRDNLINREITICSGHKKHSGTCVGINAQGHLLIKKTDDKVQAYSSGDASLLK